MSNWIKNLTGNEILYLLPTGVKSKDMHEASLTSVDSTKYEAYDDAYVTFYNRALGDTIVMVTVADLKYHWLRFSLERGDYLN